MTPGARVAAAIEIIDAIEAGQAAEQALTRWARNSRFAGSKDRAAVRDHVFDALRHWRSDSARGGGTTGRARMIGRMRSTGIDPDEFFTGIGHAPPPLRDGERIDAKVEGNATWDLPDWLITAFQDSLGDAAEATAHALTARAPITLRVNTSRSDVTKAREILARDDIVAMPNTRAATALSVTDGARKLRTSRAYADGLVELQDASSQAAVNGLTGQGRALDFCAGGGGKALALAAAGWDVTAHDIDPRRMRDLPDRAARGGHKLTVRPPDELSGTGTFDLVFCDAPCSGSGTWRRTPEAKWNLTQDRLLALLDMQAQVLDAAVPFVGDKGLLVYATCSLLRSENDDQVAAFLDRHPDWKLKFCQHWPVDQSGDGFYVAHLGHDPLDTSAT
jgi:16S rRNA (cytosine967-C5)-methyltransferase